MAASGPFRSLISCLCTESSTVISRHAMPGTPSRWVIRGSLCPCSAITLTYNCYVTLAPVRPHPRPTLGVRAILDSLGPLPAPGISPVLVLLVGLPGSGKSTLARRLAPAIGAAVLESDAVRRTFFDAPHAQLQREPSGLRSNLRHRDCAAGQPRVRHNRCDQSKGIDRRPAINLARTAGVDVCVVHVAAPDSVIEQRLRSREQGRAPGDSSNAGIEVMRRMRATAELSGADNWWHVNTGDSSAYEASVDRIIVALTTLAPAGIKDPGLKGGIMGGRP